MAQRRTHLGQHQAFVGALDQDHFVGEEHVAPMQNHVLAQEAQGLVALPSGLYLGLEG
ncbi:hypothetical protein [Streptomyces flaveolus]|uniref:hypothetical protein n=1 Tax=Streptomyces flaveolus TaxID=67297 RepID=UPI0036FDB410